jgi:hypothetical protein
MALQIRRGTDLQRSSQIFNSGELIYTTDQKHLWIGDGSTTGGTNVHASAAGAGLTWNPGTNKLDLNPSTFNFTTNDLVEGNNSKFFTVDRAQDAVGTLLQNGVNTGITFSYNSTTNVLTTTVTGTTTLSSDPTPALGGNLNLSTHNITGTGNINITGQVGFSGGLSTDVNLNTRSINGTGDINITGSITATTLSGNLGANLGLSSHSITGTGSISITGSIQGTSVTAGSLNTTSGLTLSATDIEDTTLNSGIRLLTNSVNGVTAVSITDGSYGGQNSTLAIFGAKGTLASPTDTLPGDYVSRLQFSGYNSSVYTNIASLTAGWHPTATMSDASPASTLSFTVNSGGTSSKSMVFSGVTGSLYVPVLFVGSYATGSYPTLPGGGIAGGLIIFDSTTKHFMGWNGTAWVAFDGP